MPASGITSMPVPPAAATGAPTATGAAKRSARRIDIDYSKAAAIVFVVIGHVSDPAAPIWAQNLRGFIYNFHMPLFMYLSGYVFFLHFQRNDRASVGSYVADRAHRLLTVFVIFYVLVMNIKFFAGGLVEVRRSGFAYFDGLKYMILHTQQSPALDLWYLVTLFLFSVATFACLRAYRTSIYGLCLVSLLMYAVFAETEQAGGLTDDFYVGRICWFYIFFMLGCVASRHWAVFQPFFQRLWAPALVALLAYQLAMFRDQERLVSGWRFLIAGGLSIIAVHGFANANLRRPHPILQALSENTLIIYLLNSIVIGAVMPLLKHRLNVHTDMPVFYAVLVPLGLLVPIAFRHCLKRIGTPALYMRYIT